MVESEFSVKFPNVLLFQLPRIFSPMGPAIFIDLDHCLIDSVFFGCEDDNEPESVIRTSIGPHSSCLRPHAGLMLSNLRSSGPVKMITTAEKNYALLHNEVFSLGFSESDILVREDFIVTIRGAYGASDHIEAASNQYPNSVLIDNESPGDKCAGIKMRFLGIRHDRYFQVREFTGLDDPPSFVDEWMAIVASVASIFTL